MKRSVTVQNHKTSVSLEEPFWEALKEIAEGRQVSISDLVSDIDSNRQVGNLSSSVRVFVLAHKNKIIDSFVAAEKRRSPAASGDEATTDARSQELARIHCLEK